MPTLLRPISVLCLAGLASCVSAPEPDVLDAEPIEAETVALEAEVHRSVPAELIPAFDAVVQALEDGEEAVARGALGRVMARQPEGRALELALAFERILDGRALCESLVLELAAEELAEPPGRFRVTLQASHSGTGELRLRTSGARLRQLLLIVDPDGREQRRSRREAVAFPAELVLAPGETLRVVLADLQLSAPPGLLAMSSDLRLEVLPGEFIEPGGRSLPAQYVAVEDLELVRLAKHLPTTTVEPEEVAAYVQRGRIYVPALMERVVRVAPERRGEALDALAPLAENMSLVELELLVPGLRWLSRTTRPGGDPEAWRIWLMARANPAEHGPNWDIIQLPGG